MNKAMIFLNGDKSDFSQVEKYIDQATLLIGCDGGTRHIADLGHKPDAIVGDLDSWDEKDTDSSAEVVRHPRDKDYTDSEAAIRYALEKGVQEIILTGFLGSRTDHMLGNIFLFDKPEFMHTKIKIIEGRQEIYLISGQAEIHGKTGETVSFLPLFGDVKARLSEGLRYDLAGYDLSMRGNSGISNELLGNTARVSLAKGDRLLVIHTRN